ncbi:heme ABC transporter ATP-binding protein [Vibrio hibernica]|uniref:heme ABC transporter ATP-binding protein n=1 Tax=Vibrio hibernica TaxID=2587465 RepID=UPI0039B094DC
MLTTSAHLATAIKARHIHLQFGNKLILNDLNLDIYQGQVTALLGPNGTGKSSLLKILSGEQSLPKKPKLANNDQEPTLHYFGKAQQDWDKSQLAKQLGMLPQQSTLTFPFLAKEVVELGGIPLSLNNHDLKQTTQKTMATVGISDLSERSYPSLSGGEKQRVHLARVLTQLSSATDNCIFMLDEPTSALDLAHQHRTLSLAKTMADNGATVIIVLHDLNLTAQYADRILLLNQGEIIADGTPWETLTPENISQVYGYPTFIQPHPTYGFPVVYPV